MREWDNGSGNTEGLVADDEMSKFYAANESDGIFKYDATQSAINNGGTIISGWVRQYDTEIDVRWFGAKGDGSTNDTTSVTNAITVAMTDGEILRVSQGNYLLSTWSMITLTDVLKIKGDGRELSRFTGAGAEYLFSQSLMQSLLFIKTLIFSASLFFEIISMNSLSCFDLSVGSEKNIIGCLTGSESLGNLF